MVAPSIVGLAPAVVGGIGRKRSVPFVVYTERIPPTLGKVGVPPEGFFFLYHIFDRTVPR